MTEIALPDLAAQIEREHQAAYGAALSAIEHAIRCGELLIQAKASVPHGQWLPWLEANVSFADRQARKYMRVAKHADQIRNSNSDLTIDGALKALAAPKDQPDELTSKKEWLLEMQRLWEEALPEAKEWFLSAIQILGTGQEIPEHFLALDSDTLRRMHDRLRRMPRMDAPAEGSPTSSPKRT
jgi:Protein of unknown function (DUF3102)